MSFFKWNALRPAIKPISSAQIITLGFALIILTGAFLLSLPLSSKSGEFTPFFDALFTATSAVCVTGLIIFDTFSHWSLFGQFIILTLIQIGGMGVVTIAVTLFMLSGKRISLKQRIVMRDSISVSQTGGIIKLTGFIIRATIVIELTAALILAYRFIPRMGVEQGLWAGLFHAISAFCNAGFDLMGRYEPYSSLTAYVGDPLVNLVIMFLIIAGGIGFLVWYDMRQFRLRFHRYRLQSKLVLATTGTLILLPFLFFFFYEFSLPQWQSLSLPEKFWAALFQAVTPRTAGFNTLDLTALSAQSYLVCILLMLIGGSPGSTAGGFKTTTFAALLLCAVCYIKKKDSVEVLGRRLQMRAISNAVTIVMLYVLLFLAGSLAISMIDGLSLKDCLFECASAIGTVGLSCGVTAKASGLSRLILILLMYFGRVGGLTLIYAISREHEPDLSRNPVEQVTIG